MDSIQRDLFHKQLKTLNGAIRFAFNQEPELIALDEKKNINRLLCEYLWNHVGGDWSPGSICREAQRIRNNPSSQYYSEKSKDAGMKQEIKFREEFGLFPAPDFSFLDLNKY